MEEKSNNNNNNKKSVDRELFLQWGNKKRLRCVRVKDHNHNHNQAAAASHRSKPTTRRLTSSFVPPPNRLTRNSEAAAERSGANEGRKSSSPEKEDRYYTTRGSVVGVGLDEQAKISTTTTDSNHGEEKKVHVWPKLYIALSNKEKEEDFMMMKGCKPAHRPKKRTKTIQRSLLLVSPGAWLTDMSQERYEVREKKSSKKRPTGLKAMGSFIETDSE
ncbi:hypothetical protein ACFE04_025331 [Oxalis oulophora]